MILFNPNEAALVQKPKLRGRSAFTLVELMVVVSVIAILAALLLPSLGQAKTRALAINCISNSRQVILAWHLYAADHDDLLPPNDDACDGNWASGCLNFDPANGVNTNASVLLDPELSRLAPFTQSAGIYKCPADRSAVGGVSRIRSISMNQAVGTRRDARRAVAGPWLAGEADPDQHLWRTYGKLSEINRPPPSQLWVIIDEHPDGINDAAFAVECGLKGRSAKMIDYPASLHGGACGIGFADGHAELHKWVDPRTMPPVTYTGGLRLNVASPNNPDVAWLQARTSALK